MSNQIMIKLSRIAVLTAAIALMTGCKGNPNRFVAMASSSSLEGEQIAFEQGDTGQQLPQQEGQQLPYQQGPEQQQSQQNPEQQQLAQQQQEGQQLTQEQGPEQQQSQQNPEQQQVAQQQQEGQQLAQEQGPEQQQSQQNPEQQQVAQQQQEGQQLAQEQGPEQQQQDGQQSGNPQVPPIHNRRHCTPHKAALHKPLYSAPSCHGKSNTVKHPKYLVTNVDTTKVRLGEPNNTSLAYLFNNKGLNAIEGSFAEAEFPLTHNPRFPQFEQAEIHIPFDAVKSNALISAQTSKLKTVLVIYDNPNNASNYIPSKSDLISDLAPLEEDGFSIMVELFENRGNKDGSGFGGARDKGDCSTVPYNTGNAACATNMASSGCMADPLNSERLVCENFCDAVADPLILDLVPRSSHSQFNLELSSPENGVKFHIQGYNQGMVQTAWFNNSTAGMLFYDTNNNSKLENGQNLFTAYSKLPTGTKFDDGFDALKSLAPAGADHIGPDNAGAHWSKIKLWLDFDRNGRCDPSEVFTMAQQGVQRINFDIQTLDVMDSYGSQVTYRASARVSIGGQVVSREVSDVMLMTNK